jgi:hypothetical protein
MKPKDKSDKDRRTSTFLSKYNHSKLPESLVLSFGVFPRLGKPGEFHSKTPSPTNGEPSREAESKVPATLVLVLEGASKPKQADSMNLKMRLTCQPVTLMKLVSQKCGWHEERCNARKDIKLAILRAKAM